MTNLLQCKDGLPSRYYVAVVTLRKVGRQPKNCRRAGGSFCFPAQKNYCNIMKNKTTTAQTVAEAKGRPMLKWVGKKPLSRIEYYPAQEKEVYGNKKAKDFNKLFWGDNLQVLSHLLKHYRGKVDLVYIDPPFDSKADYVKKVKVRGKKLEGRQQSLLEEKQYTDIWEKDEYLQFMYERLQMFRELLSETGSIYLHCDWHKNSYLRLLLDEVFGSENFINEIIWYYPDYIQGNATTSFAKKNDTIYAYAKSPNYRFKRITEKLDSPVKRNKVVWDKETQTLKVARDKHGKIIYKEFSEKFVDTVWKIGQTAVTRVTSGEHLGYPTQKPETLLRRVVEASTSPGDLVLDCFSGSGTTLAVAQKLGRRWIGCDINIGAIQTTTKRLNQVLAEQDKNSQKLIKDDFQGLDAFKIYNVNDYDLFKNELEAKQIVMDTYGVEPIRQAFFDGALDTNLVKVMPLNRVLNKHDIQLVLNNIKSQLDRFTPKTQSKSSESIYEERVILICSGAEVDIDDHLKKENKTGVEIEVWDIQRDKKHLTFKRKPEAKIEVSLVGNTLTIEVLDFHSPLLMQRLSTENERVVKKEGRVVVDDFRQIIDSIAIDVDWDNSLFNAEIIDTPVKNEVVKAKYKHQFSATIKKTVVAIKITDVLGDEFFSTFNVAQK